MNASSIFRRGAIAAAIGLACGVAGAAPIVVSFIPAATHIAVGGSTTVDMRISGLHSNSEILSAFDINMLFNPAILSNASVTFFTTPFGGTDNIYFDVGFGSGDTDVIGGSLLDDDAVAAIQPDSMVVLRFQLDGLADGFSLINLGADLDFERNFVGRRFQSLDVQVQGTCIAVGAGECLNRVPEPAGYGLLAMASLMAALGGARRRRQDKSAA